MIIIFFAISHLLFVDDTFAFCEATQGQLAHVSKLVMQFSWG